MQELKLIILVSIYSSSLFSQWNVKHLDVQDNMNQTIQKIKFYNDTIGYAMGTRGLILRSDDKGESWINVPTDIEADIMDFDFSSTGEIILTTQLEKGTYRSTNGIDFEKVFISEWDLPNVEFSPANKFYLSGAEIIYQSVNQGETWDTIYNLKHHGFRWAHVRDFSFVDSLIGYAVGDGIDELDNTAFTTFVIKTKDGGDIWDLIKEYPYDSLGIFNSVYFKNEQTGYILAGQSLITNNGGLNWEPLQDSYGATDLALINNDKLITVNRPDAYTGYGSTVFSINESDDGGITWLNPEFKNGAHLETIHFLNDSIGFVAGDYSIIMKTENCGGEIGEGYPWHLFTTSTNELSQLDIDIYPNPFEDELKIETAIMQNWKYEIYSVSGNLFNKGDLTNNEIIISDIPSGIYILVLMNENYRKVARLVKR